MYVKFRFVNIKTLPRDSNGPQSDTGILMGLFQTSLACLYVLIDDIIRIINFMGFLTAFFDALTLCGLIRLKLQRGDSHRGFKVEKKDTLWGYEHQTYF